MMTGFSPKPRHDRGATARRGRPRAWLEDLESRVLLAGNGLTDMSPWGISASANSRGSFNTWAPKVAALGIKWARVFPLFSQIEPTNGTYSWTTADANIATANANSMYLSAKLGLNVSWINSNTSVFPVNNIPEWSEYVTQTATHAKGKVAYYEVWNEPNLVSGNTPADYATTMIAAYDAAKAADPDAQVGLSVASVDMYYLKQTILSGAVDHFDFIAVHPYEDLGTLRSAGFESQFMSIVPTLRKMLADVNPAKVNVPIWFTEIGEEIGVNGNTATTQAQDLVKAYAMGIAQGVAKIQWYEGNEGDPGFGLFDSSGNPRTAATAYGALTSTLGATPGYLGWVQPNNKDYGFVFQGAAGTVMALWAPAGASDSITFAANVQVRDPLTNTTTTLNAGTPLSLTNSPVLILNVPANLLSQAQANKTLAYSWGGDFTGAAAVSIQMGGPNTESGLHQLGANATSTAVTAYGVPARFAGVSNMQRFSIDPNLLAYTTTPVQVSVTVRRDASNTNAGFNLKYESTTGYHGTGAWYTVPGNDKWYTKTWTLTDVQFGAKWGYNFALDSDGTTYSQYYIKDVTVTLLFPGITMGPDSAYNIATAGSVYTVNVTTGTVRFASDVGAGSRTVNLNVSPNATAVINATQTLNSITLGSGSSLQVPADGTGRVVLTKSLTMAATASLELADNDMIVNYTGGSTPAVAIEALVASGYAGGTWMGTGIRSSAAAANTGLYALGVLDNARRPTPLLTFSGIAIPTTAVLVKFTYVDDLDLDGLVSSNDAILFANNYAEGAPATHRIGDMNYNGRFDSNDAILFANTYNEGLPLIGGAGTQAQQGATLSASTAQIAVVSLPEKKPVKKVKRQDAWG